MYSEQECVCLQVERPGCARMSRHLKLSRTKLIWAKINKIRQATRSEFVITIDGGYIDDDRAASTDLRPCSAIHFDYKLAHLPMRANVKKKSTTEKIRLQTGLTTFDEKAQ